MKIGSTDIVDCKIGNTQVNKVYLGSNLVWEKVGAALLLDLYPNAAAAYSLRLLSSTYTGSAIRVRRSSDNTEQDIGFVDNDLDTASLLSFVGAGDGFVTTWYDQSGLGNDVAQGSASAQPQIVSSGSLVLKNLLPSLLFDGVDDEFLTNELLDTSSNNYLFSVFNMSNLDQTLVNFGDLSNVFSVGTPVSTLPSNEICLRGFDVGTNKSFPYVFNSQILLSAQTRPSSNLFVDGNPGIGTSVTRSINSVNSIGSRDGIYNMNGNLQELIIYNTDQSSNREGIEQNINKNYNIY